MFCSKHVVLKRMPSSVSVTLSESRRAGVTIWKSIIFLLLLSWLCDWTDNTLLWVVVDRLLLVYSSETACRLSVINILPYTWAEAHLLNSWFTGQLITSVSPPVQDKGHAHHPERSFVFLAFSMISVAIVCFFYC